MTFENVQPQELEMQCLSVDEYSVEELEERLEMASSTLVDTRCIGNFCLGNLCAGNLNGY